jgi:hypothetical protein
MQLALAWLLHRSPNILLIPGTSSVAHLRENLAAGQLALSPQILAELDRIAYDLVQRAACDRVHRLGRPWISADREAVQQHIDDYETCQCATRAPVV